MESLQQEHPTIQKQGKNQEIQQKSTSLNQEKGEFQDSKIQDHHHHLQQQQKQSQQQLKRPNESKNEEKMQTLNTQESKNEEEEEKKDKKNDENGAKVSENKGGNMGPRERLKRHRKEVAGQVWIPEMWGQEDFLKDWIDCSAFDAALMPQGLMLARASLMQQGRRSNSNSIRLENTTSC